MAGIEQKCNSDWSPHAPSVFTRNSMGSVVIAHTLLRCDISTRPELLLLDDFNDMLISGGHLLSMSPDLTSSLMSFGLLPSTWQPTLNAVPRISSTVPLSSLARLLYRMVRAISIISSMGMDLLCLMFFSFFRSLGGSFNALMTRDEAEGTTETAACRFWIVNFTVTRRPF